MTNRLAELMNSQDRGARLARNVLTRAFRDALVDGNIDYQKLVIMMEVFLLNPARQIDLKDDTKIANDRGNLKKEIEKNEYTIKVFLKLIRMLRFKEFKMGFFGTWHDGKQLGDGKGLIYTIDLDLGDNDDVDKFINVDDVGSIDSKTIESFYKTVSESGETRQMLSEGGENVIDGIYDMLDDDDD